MSYLNGCTELALTPASTAKPRNVEINTKVLFSVQEMAEWLDVSDYVTVFVQKSQRFGVPHQVIEIRTYDW